MKITFGYFFTHLFFTIGVMFIATLLHEAYHYFECGGGFIAGFYYFPHNWGVGVTYCQKGNSGEVVPYLISFIFVIISGYIKMRYDNKMPS